VGGERHKRVINAVTGDGDYALGGRPPVSR